MGYYFVTKWALTQGILRVPDAEARVVGSNYLKGPRGMFVGPRDWFHTEEAARQRVTGLKELKVAELRRALTRLEQEVEVIRFEETE